MTVTRFQQKRGTSAQWAASTTPLRDGEIGIDKDTGLIKVGDGLTLWPQLPAAFSSQYLPLLGKANDSYKLDGLASTDFLRSTGKAVSASDSDKLGGQLPAFYMPASAAAGFLPTSAAASFLAATGKASDADKLDGIDSTGFALAGDVAQTSATRKLATYWGSVTAFPTTGVLPGDFCLRSDVGTGGSTWYYVGPGKGISGWVHRGLLSCTSASRPATAMCYGGLEIYETDTKAFGVYDAGASLWRMFDTVVQTYTPTWTINGVTSTSLGTGGVLSGRYMRQGQFINLRLQLTVGGTGWNGGAGFWAFTAPFAAAANGVAGEASMYCKAWCAGGVFTGSAFVSPGATTLTGYLPNSLSNCGQAQARNADTTGAAGTGIPAVPSSYTFQAAGHNLVIAGQYEIP